MALNRRVILGLSTVALTATAVFAGSHITPGAAAAKARQAQMQLQAFNLGILGAMAKGATPFDAGAAQAAADNLVALSSMNQMSYWLRGSSNADMEGTKALPAIWAEGSDVGAKAKGLADAALAMQAAAGSLEGIQGAIGAVGGACGACHKAYRQSDS